MPLREALRIGGVSTIVVLGLAQIVEEVSSTGFAVLAPDIQETLGVSDAVLGAIGGAFGVLFLAGSVPLSSLADRYARTRVAAISIVVWSAMVRAHRCGAERLPAVRGPARAAASAARTSSRSPRRSWPTRTRSRPGVGCSPLDAASGTAGRALAPLVAGGLAALFAGDDGLALGVPDRRARRHPGGPAHRPAAASPAAAATRCGPSWARSCAEHEDELPVSLGVAFERLRKIRTFYFFLVGMASLGFALFSVPLFLNLIFEDEFGLSAFERGLLGTAMSVPGFIALAVVGRRIDGCSAAAHPRSMILIGGLVAGFGVFVVVAVNMPTSCCWRRSSPSATPSRRLRSRS